MDTSSLNHDAMERYTRQMIIDGWGEAGQARLAGAHVGIAGIGGLGSPAAIYLAAAGVGELTLCDNQQIELSNLNRQVLFNSGEIGESKVAAAARKLHRLNPAVRFQQRDETITDDTVPAMFAGCHLIIDCLDNFATRQVLNRFSVARRMPLLHGGIREYFGELLLLQPPDTACLNCLYTTSPKQKTPIPVCGAVAGTLGSMQALLAIRYLIGDPHLTVGELIQFDLVSMRTDSVPVPRRPGCAVCDTGAQSR